MKKGLKAVLAVLIAVLISACGTQGSGDSKIISDYYDKVNQLVTDKGYTMEEISELKSNQEVKKPYDNEVLARFGKVQGYVYDITHKWNDGLNEGPFTNKETEYSILPLEEMKKEKKDIYDDSKHFDKYTVKLSKMVIFDNYYTPDLSESYWKADDDHTDICNQILSQEDRDLIAMNAELKSKVIQTYKTDEDSNVDYVQLIVPEKPES